MHISIIIFGILLTVTGSMSDVSHVLQDYYQLKTTTPPPPPVPYSFHYKAGRFPGQIDRFQSESGDGFGTVTGTYSFIDPKFKIRTVDYTADRNGFHPHLKNYEDIQAQPIDSDAVKLEKQRHYALYQRIAAANAQPAILGAPPKDTVSVARAKDRHFELFQKISAEHQAIAAEREAERIAFEATSVPNDVDDRLVY